MVLATKMAATTDSTEIAAMAVVDIFPFSSQAHGTSEIGKEEDTSELIHLC